MDRAEVMRWVAEYERAWRDDDVPAVARLFTTDARFLTSPYSAPLVGHEAIQGVWLEDQGRRFTFAAEPVAVEGDAAVVRVEVRYLDPHEQEYRDLWVLEFAGDGRVAHYEEWAYWPGKPYSGPQDLSD